MKQSHIKILYFYLIAPFFFSFSIKAKQVPLQMAKKVAENFYQQKSGLKTASGVIKYTAIDLNGSALYYSFEFTDQTGFVIVSAEDAGQPLIGYSLNDIFEKPDPTSNLGLWLTAREQEIKYLKQNNIKSDENIRSSWDYYSNIVQTDKNPSLKASQSTTVAPLLTTIWNQSKFFNDSCPGLSATGCVATAMAQIMKFWNYPSQGTGSSSYCNCISHGYSNEFGNLSANYSLDTYNWNNMPSNVTGPNPDLAQLMYHCGVSVKMNYSPGGSTAYVIKADNYFSAENSFITYFGYDPNTIQGLSRINYSNALWLSMLKRDLNLGRPVQYVGFANVGGHTWVCDGYDEIDFFHMNWGWGGSGNGYFSINALNPNGMDFTLGQEGLFGIVPLGLNAVVIKENKVYEGDFTLYPNPSSGKIFLKFNSGNLTDVKIQFLDLYGSEMIDIVDAEYKTGEQSVIINKEGALTKGIYFVIVICNKIKTIRKLIVA